MRTLPRCWHRIATSVLACSLLLPACSLQQAEGGANDTEMTVFVDVGNDESGNQGASSYMERAAKIVGGLTTEQMAAATIMPSADAPGILPSMSSASDDDIARLSRDGWFGIILTTPNIESSGQLRSLTKSLHQAGAESAVGLPFALAVDEEGGMVRRVSGKDGMGIDAEPSPSDVGASGDDGAAFEAGRRIGGYLSDLGFDIDFAPVVDIRTDSCDEIMASRCLSDSPDVVSRLALSQLQGLSDGGVAGCLKHYPGLGPTYGDSHEESVTSDKGLEELLSSDLIPYSDAIGEGTAPMVMVGHILTPNLTDDGLPASLSPQAISVLRERLGYDGLVITDSLGMQAALNAYPQDELAWRAVAAGADVALMPVDAVASRDAMAEATKRGDLPEARLRDAATKAVAMRIALCEGDAFPWD